jgi:hypothetical protein
MLEPLPLRLELTVEMGIFPRFCGKLGRQSCLEGL